MEKMLEFGQEYVGSKILSENNAITYRLTVKGTNRCSENKPDIKLNDISLNPSYKEGLNFIVLLPDNTVKEEKSFDVSNPAMLPALKEYINALTNELVITYSYDHLVSSSEYETIIKSLGSILWNHKMITRYPATSYASIFRADIKKICAEVIEYTNDDSKDSDADIELVYDSFHDIGLTGLPGSIIKDSVEYKSTQKNDYKRWPDNSALRYKLSDYNLKPGDYVIMSASVFGDTELKNEGGRTRIDFRWVKGTTWKESIYIESTTEGDYPAEEMVNPDIYEHKYIYGKIPEEADGFIIIASRYNALTGLSKIKNLMINKTVEPVDKNLQHRQVSINGIRSDLFVQDNIIVNHEGNDYNSLLHLQNGSSTTESIDFVEY